jgi:pSer/pThr/pTyr-binding forkhead associated (FHA) protein
VGREAGNALSLVTESTVSRRHATLVRSGASVAIRDEGSSNGTYVNGVKISSETELKPGDQVQFGEVRFRFEA